MILLIVDIILYYYSLDVEWLTHVCDSYNNNWLTLFLKFISITKSDMCTYFINQ
jgi:hypothetical protein